MATFFLKHSYILLFLWLTEHQTNYSVQSFLYFLLSISSSELKGQFFFSHKHQSNQHTYIRMKMFYYDFYATVL